jgi:hypothetical protein
MKMEDHHDRVVISVPYKEAEKLFFAIPHLINEATCLHYAHYPPHLNGEITQTDVKIIDKLWDKLDEYVNT